MKINLVIIGNIGYDIGLFLKEGGIYRKNVSLGGSCFFSGIAASKFCPVGIVSKIGDDIKLDFFKKIRNFDLSGLKILKNQKSIRFVTKFLTLDGRERIIRDYINPKLILSSTDIPFKYLKAKFIHLATYDPKIQLELIKFIKTNSNAIVSIDTIKGYSLQKETKEAFDLADIAFIDKEFTELLNCNAPIKIIKLGKEGCIYKSEEGNVLVENKDILQKVVDKTGAGDCLNGAFLAQISSGIEPIISLKSSIELATKSVQDYGILHVLDYTIND